MPLLLSMRDACISGEIIPVFDMHVSSLGGSGPGKPLWGTVGLIIA